MSGRDLAWFFDQALSSPDKLDYAVGDLQAYEIAATAGAKDAVPAPAHRKAARIFRSEVTIVRLGEMIFPQEIEVTFEGGEKVSEFWNGRDRWKRYTYDRAAKVLSAAVDPGGRLLLDANWLNNSRVIDTGTAAPAKFGAGLLKWFQGLLSFLGP